MTGRTPKTDSVEVRVTPEEKAQWVMAAGNVPLSRFVRQCVERRTERITFQEACPEHVRVHRNCIGTERTGAAVMLTVAWQGTDQQYRSFDLFLSAAQAETLAAELTAALREEQPAARVRLGDAEQIPGWPRWVMTGVPVKAEEQR